MECGQLGGTKNLNHAMREYILKPPAVLTDSVECQESRHDEVGRD
jgi:hypothetical protein